MFFKKSRKKIINIEGVIYNEVVIKCALENLIEVSKVKVDLNKKQIIVSYDGIIDNILLTEVIKKLGLIVTDIKE